MTKGIQLSLAFRGFFSGSMLLATMAVFSLAAFSAGEVQAVVINFDGGAVLGCDLDGWTYSCDSSPSTASDNVAIADN
jgi:hypothetical protein